MHSHHHRPKMPPPIFWERPYFPNWEPNMHYQPNYLHTPDDYDDYYRRQAHNDYYRYDSDGTLNVNKTKLMSPPPLTSSPVDSNGITDCCSNRFYTKPVPIQHSYCSCEKSASALAIPMWRTNQVRIALHEQFSFFFSRFALITKFGFNNLSWLVLSFD